MKSLYHLVQDYRQLEEIDTDGELDEHALQAIHDTLEGLQGEIEIKATNVGAFVLNLEAYAEAAAEASKALSARAKRIQRRADVMREYLRTHIAGAGIKKIEGPEFTLARKMNPPAVIIEPGAQLPEEFLQPPDPLIQTIIRGVAEIPRDVASLIESTPPVLIAEEYLLVTPAELAQIIERQLPARAPDKKKVGEALKAAVKAHEAAVKAATGKDEPAPVFVNPLPGCRLEQGERLEIRP